MSAIDPDTPPGEPEPDSGPPAGPYRDQTPPPPPLETPVAVPPSVPKRPKPVGESERLQTLDVVRGIAIYGILFVNIEDFAMVQDARYDPAISGGAGPWNHGIWLFTFLFCDTKFLAIFTMLFGAGIAIINRRRRQRGQRATWMMYYRRMCFLLALGVAHGLLLWRGDILYFYALGGLVLYLAPRLPTMVLALGGLGLFAAHVQRFAVQLFGIWGGYSWWQRQIYQGGWWDQFQYRRHDEIYYLRDVPLEFAPHIIGLMLLGMALLKSGFLGGKWPRWMYALVAVAGLGAGFGMVANGTDLTPYFRSHAAAETFLWGSLLLAFGYMGTLIGLTLFFGKWLPFRALASVGRMALTNYLMQTVICTTIFFGYGFGLFERTQRTEQLVVVLSICAFQLVFSHLWLKAFRFGPMEWLWRSFSYWKFQPMLHRPAEKPVERPVGL